MPSDLSGAELDAKFFGVCWPGQVHVDRTGLRQLSKPPVSTDANACEAWAMRWAREQGLRWEVKEMANDFMAIITMPNHPHGWFHGGRGTDWKQALVRACVAAGLVLNQSKGGA